MDNLGNAQEEPVRARLKWFNAPKGFGFVVPVDEEIDAFLHVTTLQRAGLSVLGEGADILCHIQRGPKGAMVTEVTEILNPGALPEQAGPERNGYATGGSPIHKITLDGTVKWYRTDKGFGFVVPEDGDRDIFIHKACLEQNGLAALTQGQTVRMTVRTTPKGREAVSIAIADAA